MLKAKVFIDGEEIKDKDKYAIINPRVNKILESAPNACFNECQTDEGIADKTEDGSVS